MTWTGIGRDCRGCVLVSSPPSILYDDEPGAGQAAGKVNPDANGGGVATGCAIVM
jgi:hypothetical protein